MTSGPVRRVVTGLDAQGRSCVLFDGPMGQGPAGLVWMTPAMPADNSGSADAGTQPFSFDIPHGGGTAFVLWEAAPGEVHDWHATDTIDYLTVMEGEIVLTTQAGELTLRAGDVFVDRGVIHAWANRTDRPFRATIAMLPAHPVGAGRTV